MSKAFTELAINCAAWHLLAWQEADDMRDCSQLCVCVHRHDYWLLTMSMAMRRSVRYDLVVKFSKMSAASSCSSLNATARWWFSSTELSLYMTASSSPSSTNTVQYRVLKTWLVSCQYGGLVVILPILIGCHELFKQNIHCASKMHQVWNGIAQNYRDRFWWHLAEIFETQCI